MTIFSSLKTLPLLAALTAGIALIPAFAIAGNHHAEAYNSQHTQHKTRTEKHAYQDKRHAQTNYRNPRAMHSGQRRHANKYHKRHRVIHNREYRRYKHAHEYPAHYRSYAQQAYFPARSGLRLMLGLHTDNLDIVFRD